MQRTPELFDRGVKARSLAYLYAAGAALGLATLAFPHGEEVNDLALVLLAAAALSIAALVYLGRERVGELQLHAALALGTLIVTVANHYVGTAALYPIMYSWVALYAFYFFPLRQALAHIALIGAAYAILLAIQEPMAVVVRWLLAVGTPTVAGVLISRLLSELRQEATRSAEHARALGESEARTRMILERAQNAFLSVDAEGMVSAWNAAAERMFGWRADEALGRPLRELIFPEEGKRAHDERREALLRTGEGGPDVRIELELCRRDRTCFPAEVTISHLRFGDEPVLAGFVQDLSERRRQEEEREQLLREQAAREEAERVAETVSGMQLLVDAALAHRGLEDMLGDLVSKLRLVLDADAASIFLAEEGERLLLRASTGDRALKRRPEVGFGECFPGRVASEGRPLLAEDPPATDLVDPAMVELAPGSAIGVPLLAEGEVTGVIQVAVARPRRFAGQDLATLRLAADRVALAIGHARVYEREHKIAESLQRSLLPERLPHLPGLAVAARYLPAAAEAEVGGDWYDVIPLPGGEVGLVMGDVAGKGLAAASMVGRMRSALRAYALEGHGTATVIERLNRLVWTELGETQMATLAYVVLDPAEGVARWVNAGHPPPLVVSDGEARFLERGSSVPLGVMPFPPFEELSVDVTPGASVLLYTDGLVERVGERIDRGLERLAAAVARGPDDPEQLCDHVVSELVPEGATSDDVALLALRNTPMTDRFSIVLPTEPESLAAMRTLLRRWLQHLEGSDQEIAEITTACGEAATNAIEHAGVTGGAPFTLAGSVEGSEVDITVRDYGAWRAPRDGDRGRGLSLMRALMDSVEVTASAEGTVVRMRRVLDGGTPE